MIKRLTLAIFGRVQGVFFRQSAADLAESLGLTGWVKNDRGLSVKAVAEGPEDKLKKFLQFCETGSELAQVERVEAKWEDGKNEFSDFRIVY